MSNTMKKSALYDLMAHHSDFNFDTFMESAVRDEDQDDWNAYLSGLLSVVFAKDVYEFLCVAIYRSLV